MILHVYDSATQAWFQWLRVLTNPKHYRVVAPRGVSTWEVPHLSTGFRMDYPVVTVPERNLSYKFLAGEALWILSGSDRVDGIAPYNKRIADYSDDGVTFFGAYGPKFVDQLPYVVENLKADGSSRQAVITLWRESPPATKDVPCTVALQFALRDDQRLHAHVFMRSSDAWLGVPYDWFNFTMLALRVAQALNEADPTARVSLGNLYFTAACAHAYCKDEDPIRAVLRSSAKRRGLVGPRIPFSLTRDPERTTAGLLAARDRNEPPSWR